MKTPPAEHRSLPSGLTAAIVRAASLARIGIAVSFMEGGEQRFVYVSDVAARFLDSTPSDLLIPSSKASLRPDSGLDSIALCTASSSAEVDGRQVTVDFLFDTEARSRAEKLERSRTRFKMLLDAAPEGVVIVVDERIEYANPALVRMLGYGAIEQVTEKPLLDHLHPEDSMRVLDQLRVLMKTGESIGPSELRTRRQDGAYVPLEVLAILAEWEGRRAVLAVARDLHQRRQQKSQTIQADRLTALGTLAAGVAHEINNPLAYVLLNLQYLLREVPKFKGETARLQLFLERLHEARHGTERVSTIVRDLRAFAHTEQETKSTLDLRRVLASAIRVAGPQIEGHAHIVEDYTAVPPIEANATRLEQVFLNLIINAAQAFPQSNVVSNEIRVSVRAEGDRVIAEVADNGPGIDGALLSRVFDPFFTTKPGVGTGLGLPICHSIVTRLGGEIDVASTRGVGTVFRVALPVRPRYRPEEVLTPPPSSVRAARARVLVVDDELPLASMLSRVLSDEHEVFIATSAREALEQLRKTPDFDVILCDLLMPAMSGMDLYRELKSQLAGLEERMVFMTGGAFTPRAAEFLASVPNLRLEKPFDLNQVRQLVRKLSRAPAESGERA